MCNLTLKKLPITLSKKNDPLAINIKVFGLSFPALSDCLTGRKTAFKCMIRCSSLI
eukprot:m.314978 g.314978  ORF g.314978 m.314978 type:complete len:56 (+) comp595076_c0_seq1:30-197(+)